MKTVKNILVFFAVILMIVSSSNFVAAGGFKWTGAWQPCRISAGDGITQLGTKIGTFITLPDKESYAQVIFNVNNRFPGSSPWSTWAVGDLSKATPPSQGLSEEQHEEYLTYMDQLGVTIFLEIFPFKTDVLETIDYWLGKFKHHKCIAGFGVDLEYYGKANDSTAKAWDEKVKSHNPAYRLFLRHYSADYMPPTYRGKSDLIFIDDSSEATVEELNKDFAGWANRFAPTACAFQIGYPADEDGMNGSNELGWWKLNDPIKDWGDSLISLINNPNQEIGLIWVTAKSGKTYNTNWDLTKGAVIPQTKD